MFEERSKARDAPLDECTAAWHREVRHRTTLGLHRQAVVGQHRIDSQAQAALKNGVACGPASKVCCQSAETPAW